MIEVRKSAERGSTDAGWLQSKHTFSFADYWDPTQMGFSVLRVINEDVIAGGSGFGTHPHRDMEIISYVVNGALKHQDSMNNSAIITPGEVQRMSAGTGVEHSEFNHLANAATHFLQIWILPEKKGITPSYGQKSFSNELTQGRLVLVASRDGRENSVTINQDVNLYAYRSTQDGEINFTTQAGRKIWIQIVKGTAIIDSVTLNEGDGAALTNETNLKVKCSSQSEMLFFDLP
jgi:redox-sensitive bicupin YhaK (pirin superfamily)